MLPGDIDGIFEVTLPIKCNKCGKQIRSRNNLAYSVGSINGHIHKRCNRKTLKRLEKEQYERWERAGFKGNLEDYREEVM